MEEEALGTKSEQHLRALRGPSGDSRRALASSLFR